MKLKKVKYWPMLILLAKVPYHGLHCRASFELEAGAVGQTTDFKEGSRRLEWNLKKASVNKDMYILHKMICICNVNLKLITSFL